MRKIKASLVVAVVWCGMCGVTPSHGMESYVTPRLRLSVGYDSNRLRTADNQEGSSFLELVPGASFVLFAKENLQWNADGEYAQRQFAGSAKGDQAVWQAGVGVAWQKQSVSYELWGGAGGYKDSEIPDDDARWFYIAPSMGWSYAAGRQVYLRGNYSPSDYDSRLTYDGKAENGTFVSATSGWATSLGKEADLWIEGYYENFTANEPVDEYRTFGAASGVGRWMSAAGRLDFSARWGYQKYPSDLEGITDRDTQPVRLSTQYAHRFTDWVALELLARWERLATSDVMDEYEQWLASASLLFSWDLALGKSAH